MEDQDQHTIEQPEKRNTFLTVLCILTFISCGLGVLRFFIIPSMARFLIEFIKQSPKYDPDAYAETFRLLEAGWGYYFVTLLLSLLALAGALLMWNMRKSGFHFYTIANILLLYLPVVWLDLRFNFFEGFITAAFVTMYAMHMRFMR